MKKGEKATTGRLSVAHRACHPPHHPKLEKSSILNPTQGIPKIEWPGLINPGIKFCTSLRSTANTTLVLKTMLFTALRSSRSQRELKKKLLYREITDRGFPGLPTAGSEVRIPVSGQKVDPGAPLIKEKGSVKLVQLTKL